MNFILGIDIAKESLVAFLLNKKGKGLVFRQI